MRTFSEQQLRRGDRVASSDALMRPEPTIFSLATLLYRRRTHLARAPPALDSTLSSAISAEMIRRSLVASSLISGSFTRQLRWSQAGLQAKLGAWEEKMGPSGRPAPFT